MRRAIRRFFALCILLPALALVPCATSAWHLFGDPGLRSASSSRFAFTLHRSLSKRIPSYVDARIASGAAETLDVSQITATEWPVYGAFFYLLATENLQHQWENDPSLSAHPPTEYGAAAIEASVRIMLDEGHAHWVKTYWGDDYLQDPNCFYRMLMIGSLTAHHNLTGKDDHLPLLRTLVDDLATDIDRSPVGLVDDYPDQCFPADVGVATAMIRHAGIALGSDRKEWAKAAMDRLVGTFGGPLPPYMAVDDTGRPLAPSRGCTNGFFFSFIRSVDPDIADRLYANYASGFWQENDWCAGWREFPRPATIGGKEETYFDPDSGPVIGGFGTSATGLGLGAARLHGDHERAGKLGAELITTSLPLPGGRLLVPAAVGDPFHAPHFPEIVMLHQLSLSSTARTPPAPVPWVVWAVLGTEFLLGVLSLRVFWRLWRGKKRREPRVAP
ncbi:dinitrogenase reductase activating glycohydrolase [Haloferula helveola]|uniref:Dinitrogenase reductase activating glycohydrolase n=1 Tax=Haloferula helveola TaxID=490095 RepID=A0ABM7RKM8_9BACT|nr:dinitrogenase reductase activating glycohydrolase [Haloferula helveola]